MEALDRLKRKALFWIRQEGSPEACIDELLEPSGDGLDRFHSRAEAGHGLAMAFQLSIRDIADVHVGDSGEGGPSDLGTDLFLTVVRGHQEESLDGLPGGPEGKVEEAHDP